MQCWLTCQASSPSSLAFSMESKYPNVDRTLGVGLGVPVTRHGHSSSFGCDPASPPLSGTSLQSAGRSGRQASSWLRAGNL